MPPPQQQQQLQISIPTTSTATDNDNNKPYTLYHVQLTLPIRIHETRKRYSDFVALYETLTAQTGAPPPASLPPKSWLRRTVNNPALTETRRIALEAFLRAILEAEDPRWRSSTAWRAFLNLPTADSTRLGTKQGQSLGLGVPEATIVDPNEWLDVHRQVKTHIHNARQLLKKREAAQTAQEQHAVSADAKAALVRAAAAIASLHTSLAALGRKKGGHGGDDDDGGWGAPGSLGDGEIRRRRDLLGASKKEVESLETSLRSLVVKNAGSMLNGASAGAVATDSDKEALWRGTGAATGTHRSARVLGGPAKETERTRELGNAGVLQLQRQIMAEQEEDVLEIGKAVSRMKEMGIMINEELVVQNQMLGLLDQDVGRVEGKIGVAKKKIGKIR